MRAFLIILAAIVVLVGGAVFFFFSNLDGLIESAIESYGGEATQTRVELANVDLSLTSGKGSLQGLTIENPAGFSDDDVFTLGEIAIALDLAKLQACSPSCDVIHISSVDINSPRIVYEIGGDMTNIDRIRKNVEEYAARVGGSASQDEAEGPKLIIDRLTIRDGGIKLKTGLGKLIELDLPEMNMTNIGQASGGAAPGEIISAVVGRLTQGVTQAVATAPIDEVIEGVGDVGGAVGDVGGAVGDVLDGAVKGIFD
jgi:hypothetical protein